MSFRALVEKSPAKETITSVHVMRRDEGVPPYRRLRRESDTLSFRGGSQEIQRNRNGNNRPRLPKYSPAVAHRREITRGRNEDERARIINQANDLNALSLRGASATWQSPGREDLLAYTTTQILTRGGSPTVRLTADIRSRYTKNDEPKGSSFSLFRYTVIEFFRLW